MLAVRRAFLAVAGTAPAQLASDDAARHCVPEACAAVDQALRRALLVSFGPAADGRPSLSGPATGDTCSDIVEKLHSAYTDALRAVPPAVRKDALANVQTLLSIVAARTVMAALTHGARWCDHEPVAGTLPRNYPRDRAAPWELRPSAQRKVRELIDQRLHREGAEATGASYVLATEQRLLVQLYAVVTTVIGLHASLQPDGPRVEKGGHPHDGVELVWRKLTGFRKIAVNTDLLKNTSLLPRWAHIVAATTAVDVVQDDLLRALPVFVKSAKGRHEVKRAVADIVVRLMVPLCANGFLPNGKITAAATDLYDKCGDPWLAKRKRYGGFAAPLAVALLCAATREKFSRHFMPVLDALLELTADSGKHRSRWARCLLHLVGFYFNWGLGTPRSEDSFAHIDDHRHVASNFRDVHRLVRQLLLAGRDTPLKLIAFPYVAGLADIAAMVARTWVADGVELVAEMLPADPGRVLTETAAAGLHALLGLTTLGFAAADTVAAAPAVWDIPGVLRMPYWALGPPTGSGQFAEDDIGPLLYSPFATFRHESLRSALSADCTVWTVAIDTVSLNARSALKRRHLRAALEAHRTSIEARLVATLDGCEKEAVLGAAHLRGAANTAAVGGYTSNTSDRERTVQHTFAAALAAAVPWVLTNAAMGGSAQTSQASQRHLLEGVLRVLPRCLLHLNTSIAGIAGLQLLPRVLEAITSPLAKEAMLVCCRHARSVFMDVEACAALIESIAIALSTAVDAALSNRTPMASGSGHWGRGQTAVASVAEQAEALALVALGHPHVAVRRAAWALLHVGGRAVVVEGASRPSVAAFVETCGREAVADARRTHHDLCAHGTQWPEEHRTLRRHGVGFYPGAPGLDGLGSSSSIRQPAPEPRYPDARAILDAAGLSAPVLSLEDLVGRWHKSPLEEAFVTSPTAWVAVAALLRRYAPSGGRVMRYFAESAWKVALDTALLQRLDQAEAWEQWRPHWAVAFASAVFIPAAGHGAPSTSRVTYMDTGGDGTSDAQCSELFAFVSSGVLKAGVVQDFYDTTAATLQLAAVCSDEVFDVVVAAPCSVHATEACVRLLEVLPGQQKKERRRSYITAAFLLLLAGVSGRALLPATQGHVAPVVPGNGGAHVASAGGLVVAAAGKSGVGGGAMTLVIRLLDTVDRMLELLVSSQSALHAPAADLKGITAGLTCPGLPPLPAVGQNADGTPAVWAWGQPHCFDVAFGVRLRLLTARCIAALAPAESLQVQPRALGWAKYCCAQLVPLLHAVNVDAGPTATCSPVNLAQAHLAAVASLLRHPVPDAVMPLVLVARAVLESHGPDTDGHGPREDGNDIGAPGARSVFFRSHPFARAVAVAYSAVPQVLGSAAQELQHVPPGTTEAAFYFEAAARAVLLSPATALDITASEGAPRAQSLSESGVSAPLLLHALTCLGDPGAPLAGLSAEVLDLLLGLAPHDPWALSEWCRAVRTNTVFQLHGLDSLFELLASCVTRTDSAARATLLEVAAHIAPALSLTAATVDIAIVLRRRFAREHPHAVAAFWGALAEQNAASVEALAGLLLEAAVPDVRAVVPLLVAGSPAVAATLFDAAFASTVALRTDHSATLTSYGQSSTSGVLPVSVNPATPPSTTLGGTFPPNAVSPAASPSPSLGAADVSPPHRPALDSPQTSGYAPRLSANGSFGGSGLLSGGYHDAGEGRHTPTAWFGALAVALAMMAAAAPFVRRDRSSQSQLPSGQRGVAGPTAGGGTLTQQPPPGLDETQPPIAMLSLAVPREQLHIMVDEGPVVVPPPPIASTLSPPAPAARSLSPVSPAARPRSPGFGNAAAPSTLSNRRDVGIVMCHCAALLLQYAADCDDTTGGLASSHAELGAAALQDVAVATRALFVGAAVLGEPSGSAASIADIVAGAADPSCRPSPLLDHRHTLSCSTQWGHASTPSQCTPVPAGTPPPSLLWLHDLVVAADTAADWSASCPAGDPTSATGPLFAVPPPVLLRRVAAAVGLPSTLQWLRESFRWLDADEDGSAPPTELAQTQHSVLSARHDPDTGRSVAAAVVATLRVVTAITPAATAALAGVVPLAQRPVGEEPAGPSFLLETRLQFILSSALRTHASLLARSVAPGSLLAAAPEAAVASLEPVLAAITAVGRGGTAILSELGINALWWTAVGLTAGAHATAGVGLAALLCNQRVQHMAGVVGFGFVATDVAAECGEAVVAELHLLGGEGLMLLLTLDRLCRPFPSDAAAAAYIAAVVDFVQRFSEMRSQLSRPLATLLALLSLAFHSPSVLEAALAASPSCTVRDELAAPLRDRGVPGLFTVLAAATFPDDDAPPADRSLPGVGRSPHSVAALVLNALHRALAAAVDRALPAAVAHVAGFTTALFRGRHAAVWVPHCRRPFFDVLGRAAAVDSPEALAEVGSLLHRLMAPDAAAEVGTPRAQAPGQDLFSGEVLDTLTARDSVLPWRLLQSMASNDDTLARVVAEEEGELGVLHRRNTSAILGNSSKLQPAPFTPGSLDGDHYADTYTPGASPRLGDTTGLDGFDTLSALPQPFDYCYVLVGDAGRVVPTVEALEAVVDLEPGAAPSLTSENDPGSFVVLTQRDAGPTPREQEAYDSNEDLGADGSDSDTATR